MYLAKCKGPLCSAKMQIFNFAFATAVSASRGAKNIAPNYMRVDISPFAALKVLELRMYRPCQCLPHVNISGSASRYGAPVGRAPSSWTESGQNPHYIRKLRAC